VDGAKCIELGVRRKSQFDLRGGGGKETSGSENGRPKNAEPIPISLNIVEWRSVQIPRFQLKARRRPRPQRGRQGDQACPRAEW